MLDSRKPTCLDRADEFPSHRFESFPLTTQNTPDPLKTPVRHLIAASSSEMVGMASRDGYWNSLHMALGLTMGRHEMIAMDAVEEGDRILVAVAIAEVSVYGIHCHVNTDIEGYHVTRKSPMTHFSTPFGSLAAQHPIWSKH